MKVKLDRSFIVNGDTSPILENIVKNSYSFESVSIMEYFVKLEGSDVVDMMRFVMSTPIRESRDGVPTVSKHLYKLDKGGEYVAFKEDIQSEPQEFYTYLLGANPIRILSSVESKAKIHGCTLRFRFTEDLKIATLVVEEARIPAEELLKKLSVESFYEIEDSSHEREVLKVIARESSQGSF